MRTLRISLTMMVMLVLLGASHGTLSTLGHAPPVPDGPRPVVGTLVVGPHFQSATFDDARLGGRLWLSKGDGRNVTPILEIVNGDGSWIGRIRGYATLDPWARHCHAELTGTGRYLGLSALLHISGRQEGPWDVEGFIYPSPVRAST